MHGLRINAGKTYGRFSILADFLLILSLLRMIEESTLKLADPLVNTQITNWMKTCVLANEFTRVIRNLTMLEKCRFLLL